jgi:plastocyanin domain-containing protein
VAGARVEIAVEESGFVPDQVQVERGKPVTLVFTRKIENTCVDKVVFPAEGIEKDLPLGKPVEVALAPSADTSFRCPMGHALGRVAVK